VGYKTDTNGKIVVSKLNTDVLEEIASITDGEFLHIQGNRTELSAVKDYLNTIEKRDFEDRVFTDYADQFQYFIAIALLLLFFEFLISERKSGWFKRWSLFGETPAANVDN
jgi:Ca-activated chloride channel family protein